MKTLKDRLQNWTDIDVAEFLLGATLGLWEDTQENFAVKYKHVFWSVNPLGGHLHEILMGLADLDIVEYDGEELRIRWKA